jgi:hypothetical protein
MRIRHKRTGVEIEGPFQEERSRTACYFVPGELTAYFMCEWEEVKPPQPTWRDVTAECEWGKDGLVRLIESDFHRCSVHLCGPAYLWPEQYRLTKISGPLTPHVAFIVEKRA